MGLSTEQIEPIKIQFVQDYLLREPYSNYVNMVGVSNLGMMQSQGEEFDLNADETLADLCIGVGFKEQPPEGLEFPTKFQGVRVFYQEFGELKPL